MQRADRHVLVRFVGEFLIIVVGVLVALQVESWRDRRVDRAREAEQLAALHDDFGSNEEMLAEAVSRQRRTRDATDELLSFFQSGTAEVAADSIAELYSLALGWFSFHPVSGAYDALVASGDIGLLQNTQLRRALAEFYGKAKAGFGDHQNELDVMALMLTESAGLHFDLEGEAGGSSSARAEAAAVKLIGNRTLGGLVEWKAYLAQIRLDRLEGLAAQVNRIKDLLEVEIGRA